jgi:hypothetical protein
MQLDNQTVADLIKNRRTRSELTSQLSSCPTRSTTRSTQTHCSG